jgi:hypothetical protein
MIKMDKSKKMMPEGILSTHGKDQGLKPSRTLFESSRTYIHANMAVENSGLRSLWDLYDW